MIFSKLSTDSQMAIFSHLPPADQISTALICRRLAALPVTRQRKSITLLIGSTSLEHTAAICINKVPYSTNFEATLNYLQWSAISISGDAYTRPFIKKLLAAFPNLSNLSILLPHPKLDPNHFDQSLYLLSRLTTQLITFKLISSIYIDRNALGHNQAHLLRTLLNSSTSLKHLTLHLNHSLGSPFDLPILRQLKTFYFSSQNTIENILPALKQYTQTNTHLQAIGIGNYIDSIGQHTKLLQLDPQLTKRFTILGTNASTPSFTEAQLLNTSLQFPNLTSLSLELSYWSKLTATLAASFPLLTHLHLHINTRSISEEQCEPSAILPAITHLTIVGVFDSGHQGLYRLYIAYTFPNLHIITLDRPTCWEHNGQKNIVNINHCLGEILQPLVQCTHLQLIVLRSAATAISKNAGQFKICYLQAEYWMI